MQLITSSVLKCFQASATTRRHSLYTVELIMDYDAWPPSSFGPSWTTPTGWMKPDIHEHMITFTNHRHQRLHSHTWTQGQDLQAQGQGPGLKGQRQGLVTQGQGQRTVIPRPRTWLSRSRPKPRTGLLHLHLVMKMHSILNAQHNIHRVQLWEQQRQSMICRLHCQCVSGSDGGNEGVEDRHAPGQHCAGAAFVGATIWNSEIGRIGVCIADSDILHPHNMPQNCHTFGTTAPNCRCFTTSHKAVSTPENLHCWSDWSLTLWTDH